MTDLSSVAHDLGTPLTAILGQIQLLAEEQLSKAGRRRVEIIEAQVRRMARLIESQLASHQPSGFAPIDLCSTIQRVLGELEVMLQHGGVQVTLVGEHQIPPVVGNGDALHRALVNIIKNAADAMAAGGRLRVSVHKVDPPAAPAPSVAIEIADTGSGIPRDLQDRVFDRRFTTKPAGRGAGLGLAICREIAEAHGGRIELSSEIGRGTIVRLLLPLDPRQTPGGVPTALRLSLRASRASSRDETRRYLDAA